MGFFRKDRLDPGNGIYPFDPAMPVSPYQRIAVVGGSWRDMGRQYVAQCREGFVARCAAAFADYYGALGDEGRVRGMGRRYLRACERDFPQLIELVDGMAEEAGVAFGDAVLALYGISMLRAERECSEVAAWGGATRDGHLIGASNMDLGYEAREFLPAVLAYPEDGNAFISCELFHRTCLNEKGVLLQGSGHQNAGEGSIRRPTNDDPRHMWNDANVWAAAFADSAAEAMAPYRDWEFVTGCNQLAGDPSHDVWLMEFTGKKKRVRRAGDLGERDYLMENNGSHHPDMQDCINQGAAYWSDTDPRYWTVQKHVEDRWGSLTKRDLFEAESHGDFYVPEGWSRPYRADWGLNVWRRDASQPVPAGWHSNWNPADSGDAAFGDWSPQVHSVDFRPVLRHIVDVEDRAFYCMKGHSEPALSLHPHSLGTFWKVRLVGGARAVVEEAFHELERQLWYAGRDLHRLTAPEPVRAAAAERAKELMYEGINWNSLAVCAEAAGEAFDASLLYGKALSAFCGGQCHARVAQDDPQAFDQR